MNSFHWGDFVSDQTRKYGPLVVGIDPDREHSPEFMLQAEDFLGSYAAAVIEASTGQAGFVKFQSAFFEAEGSRGLRALAESIAAAKSNGLGVILDAKRGDIGSTAAAYARGYLTPPAGGGRSDLEVDCITINPFLGPETLEPWVECSKRYGKGLFILAKTSNPGAGWIQDTESNGQSISSQVASQIDRWANETLGTSGLSSIGAVVGITYPQTGEVLRRLMPHSIFLAPGFGPQGGSVSSLRALEGINRGSVLVPSSRAICGTTEKASTRDEYLDLLRARISALRSELE